MTNQTQININLSEKELEDFLCSDNNLEKYLSLKFIARQVSIPPIGIIDILAYHKESKCWVIIELKKDSLDTSAFCQLSSYLNYYRKTKSFIDVKNFHKERKFCGLLIGSSLDINLIKCVDYSDFSCHVITYRLFRFTLENGIKFSYCNPEQLSLQNKLDNLALDNEFKRNSYH